LQDRKGALAKRAKDEMADADYGLAVEVSVRKASRIWPP
jgi:hypothetical protein